MLRAVLIGTVAATVAIGAASRTNASPAVLIGPAGGVAMAPPPCQYVNRPTRDCVEGVDAYPVGAVAICADGRYSHAVTPSGTCSGHGGVARWLTTSAGASLQASPQSRFGVADYNYLRYLESQGVIPSDPGNDVMVAAVNLGHAICHVLDNGDTGTQLVTQTMAADNRIAEYEARSELVGAMKNYCPRDAAAANQ